MSIGIVIPTYNRASRIKGIADNVSEATFHEHNLHFVVEADDQASIDAITFLGLTPIINERTRNYSGACNTAYLKTTDEYLFAGADDITFAKGWDDPIMAMYSGDPWVAVVGTMDGVNPYVQAGTHATHYMVRREYLDKVGGIVDVGPKSWLFEGYGHNYCDTEFIGTAKMRAKFRPCFASHVRHDHWSTGAMKPDGTTAKANSSYAADSVLYDARRDLWFNISR